MSAPMKRARPPSAWAANLTENVYTDLEVNPQGDSEASINIDLSPSLTARGQVDNAGRSSVGVFFERDY